MQFENFVIKNNLNSNKQNFPARKDLIKPNDQIMLTFDHYQK